MRKMTNRRLGEVRALAACTALIGISVATEAAVHTWTGLGGNNNWNTAANWDTDPTAPPDSTSTELVYTGTAPRLTSTNTSNDFNFRSITFAADAASYTITSNSNTRILASVTGEGITQNSSNAQQFTFGTGSSGFGIDFGTTFTLKGSGTGLLTIGNAVDNGIIGSRSSSSNATLAVNNGTFDVIINSKIQNTNGGSTLTSLTKNNAGTLTLNGTNTYTGTTTVNAGTLLVGTAVGATAQSGTGNVTVGANGTLGGTGKINGATTISGQLAPGASAGSLEFTKDLTLSGTPTTYIQLGGTAFDFNVTEDYDRIKLTTTTSSTLTLTGSLNVSLINSFALVPNLAFGIFQLESGVTRSGTFAGLATDGSLVGTFGGQDLFITYSANFGDSGMISLTGGDDIALYTIPEPGTLALAGLGAAMLLPRRKRLRAM